MPLLDHFHPPPGAERRWDSFYASWAAKIAVAYRPIQRSEGDEIDVWRSSLAVGQTLPTMPLGLRADLVIPVDFEATYADSGLYPSTNSSSAIRSTSFS